MNDLFLQKVNINWDRVDEESYLRKISALKSLEVMEFDHSITFFVGENGSGKSTLLEAMAVAYGFNAEGGPLSYTFSTFDTHSELFEAIKLTKGYRHPRNGYFLRAESFYNVASKAEDYRDFTPKEVYYERFGGKSLHEQSHGESFFALISGSFTDNGLYILDEPEAALSPQRQLALLLQITKLATAGAQFIIASHSPILLGTPGAQILSFDEGAVMPCKYEDTGSYQITEMFINDREIMIKRLLEE